MYLVIIRSMRFNRVEIILRDRKRRYKNSIRGKLRGVKKRNSIEIGGILGWVFTNIIEKK